VPFAASPSTAPNSVNVYLTKMLELNASDLFLREGSPPTFRVSGEIIRSALPAPADRHMKKYMSDILSPLAVERFAKSPDVDVAYSIESVGRFRISLFAQQGRLALVARSIPMGNVEFDDLHLPAAVRKLAEARTGLVLVVGPTGCGKSTTLAALVHHINATRRDHIVTIEDPIEFVHDELEALIHQRQVGYDTHSFSTALRHVVRQSPDVILIGEMRDPDTMQTALSAALTGHLILSTLHTTNAVQSVDRMLNYFPPEARGQAQVDLAHTLVGIVAMRLLPRADGRGRVPAAEVLLGTPTVRRLIEEGAFTELYDLMKRSQESGMRTLNQALVELCQVGQVDEKTAVKYAPNPDEFRLNMDGMYTGIDSIDLRTEMGKKGEGFDLP
jgi:twitching motility protein PilT